MNDTTQKIIIGVVTGLLLSIAYGVFNMNIRLAKAESLQEYRQQQINDIRAEVGNLSGTVNSMRNEVQDVKTQIVRIESKTSK